MVPFDPIRKSSDRRLLVRNSPLDVVFVFAQRHGMRNAHRCGGRQITVNEIATDYPVVGAGATETDRNPAGEGAAGQKSMPLQVYFWCDRQVVLLIRQIF
jgi:hypothetical protein